MKDLDQKELIEINGGSFGMDVGWFLGQIISAHFVTPFGFIEALVDHEILYSQK